MAKRSKKASARKMREAAKTKLPMWTCPRCGHRFVTKHMWHSCTNVTLSAHFKGRPLHLRALFDAWRALVRKNGPMTVVSQKSRIVFMTRVRFGGAVVQNGFVWCNFWLRRRVENPLFDRVEFLAPGYFIYRFRLRQISQLRAPGLREMVAESYRLGKQESVSD